MEKEYGYQNQYVMRDFDQVYAQLGEIVAGRKPGRENDRELIFSANLGIALQDIALGKVILQTAREKGIGQILSLT